MDAQRTFEQLAGPRPTPPTSPPGTTLATGSADRQRTVRVAQRRLVLCTAIVAVMATAPVPMLRLVLGWVLFLVVIRTAPGLVRLIERDVEREVSALR